MTVSLALDDASVALRRTARPRQVPQPRPRRVLRLSKGRWFRFAGAPYLEWVTVGPSGFPCRVLLPMAIRLDAEIPTSRPAVDNRLEVLVSPHYDSSTGLV